MLAAATDVCDPPDGVAALPHATTTKLAAIAHLTSGWVLDECWIRLRDAIVKFTFLALCEQLTNPDLKTG